MKRRDFCRKTLAASFVATYPFLAGCGRETPPAATAVTADTGIPAISLDGVSIELERAAVRELGDACTGDILLAEDTTGRGHRSATPDPR